MADFLMPSLGADMDYGTVLEWRVKPGDAVKRGDIVAVIDTSKAEIEVEIFEDGVIDQLLVSEGTRVPVGAPLARVRAGTGESAPPRSPRAGKPSAPAPVHVAEPPSPQQSVAKPPPSVPPPVASETASQPHRQRVSPVARRAAEQLGVDLARVTGSGPEGAITKVDVERAATAPAPPVSPPRRERAEPDDRAAAMRSAIGSLMARSKREIPHYYLQTQIDMSRALAWLEEENRKRSVAERLLPSALLLRAVANTAAATPALNGFWVDGAFRAAERVHLGVAISLRGGGLIAPALHDADRKTLDELMAGLRDLVRRARSGRLRGSEMSDPSITVTNLGEHGVDLVHGVIYPPQVALVGFGGIHERPWAEDGMVGVRPVVVATLAADHRASDGHEGSRFLTDLDHRLQKPETL